MSPSIYRWWLICVPVSHTSGISLISSLCLIVWLLSMYLHCESTQSWPLCGGGASTTPTTDSPGDDDDAQTSSTCIVQRKHAMSHSAMKNNRNIIELRVTTLTRGRRVPANKHALALRSLVILVTVIVDVAYYRVMQHWSSSCKTRKCRCRQKALYWEFSWYREAEWGEWVTDWRSTARKDLRKMGLSWKEADATDKQECCQSVT